MDIYRKLPRDIQKIIDRMLHEMRFVEIIKQFEIRYEYIKLKNNYFGYNVNYRELFLWQYPNSMAILKSKYTDEIKYNINKGKIICNRVIAENDKNILNRERNLKIKFYNVYDFLEYNK